jgi:hypothetical protein
MSGVKWGCNSTPTPEPGPVPGFCCLEMEQAPAGLDALCFPRNGPGHHATSDPRPSGGLERGRGG